MAEFEITVGKMYACTEYKMREVYIKSGIDLPWPLVEVRKYSNGDVRPLVINEMALEQSAQVDAALERAREIAAAWAAESEAGDDNS